MYVTRRRHGSEKMYSFAVNFWHRQSPLKPDKPLIRTWSTNLVKDRFSTTSNSSFSSSAASPKIWVGGNMFDLWRTTLFLDIPPLTAQNEYMF